MQLSRDKQLAKGQDADPVAVYTLKHSLHPQPFSLHIFSPLSSPALHAPLAACRHTLVPQAYGGLREGVSGRRCGVDAVE